MVPYYSPIIIEVEFNYDREAELKAFDDTKSGVKGLVDSGVTTIPRIFHHPLENVQTNLASNDNQFSIPTIDLGGINKDPIRRKKTVDEIRDAAEKVEFFQVVNHGVTENVLQEMKNGVRRFFEQDVEEKQEFYTRDPTRKVVNNSNFDLFTATAANWRDSFYCLKALNPPTYEELPATCRDVLVEYSKELPRLGSLLFELLSEALGLKSSHLNDMGCSEGLAVICHYYPACPQPELTLGTTKHADDDFITVLIQDEIGGLQVLLDNNWIDVPPVPDALVINVGDLLQLITNDRFVSVEHRVVANLKGPRISVASFLSTSLQPSSELYEPHKGVFIRRQSSKV